MSANQTLMLSQMLNRDRQHQVYDPVYPVRNQYMLTIDPNIMTNYLTQNSNSKNKMKTSLCKKWSERGLCPYGFKCQFAHGIQQLRCNVDENLYKTKPCNAFFKKGYCQYGNRCNFSHGAAQNVQELQTKNQDQSQVKYIGYREVIQQGRSSKRSTSRLLQLVRQDEQKSERSTLSGQSLTKSQINKIHQIDSAQTIHVINGFYFDNNIIEGNIAEQQFNQFGRYQPNFTHNYTYNFSGSCGMEECQQEQKSEKQQQEKEKEKLIYNF